MKNKILFFVGILMPNFLLLSLGLQAQNEITFGNQTWTVRNLNVDTFRNGDRIKEVKTKEEWVKLYDSKQPAWCYYDFDNTNESKYGKLYNWYAINDPRGLAPKGWHIPNSRDWDSLIQYFKNSPFSKTVKSKFFDRSKNWRRPKVVYEKDWELNTKDKNNNFWLAQLGGCMYYRNDVTSISEIRFVDKGVEAKWWVLDDDLIGIQADKKRNWIRPGKYGISDLGKNDHSGAYSVRIVKD